MPPSGRLWFSWHIPGCHSSCLCQGTPPSGIHPSPPSSRLGRLPLTTAGPGVCQVSPARTSASCGRSQGSAVSCVGCRPAWGGDRLSQGDPVSRRWSSSCTTRPSTPPTGRTRTWWTPWGSEYPASCLGGLPILPGGWNMLGCMWLGAPVAREEPPWWTRGHCGHSASRHLCWGFSLSSPFQCPGTSVQDQLQLGRWAAGPAQLPWSLCSAGRAPPVSVPTPSPFSSLPQPPLWFSFWGQASSPAKLVFF